MAATTYVNQLGGDCDETTTITTKEFNQRGDYTGGKDPPGCLRANGSRMGAYLCDEERRKDGEAPT